jgi:hypothetical protein
MSKEDEVSGKKVIETPWGPLGYVVYKRTYARTQKDGTVEEFTDTVDRIVKGCDKQLKVGFTKEEEDEVRDMLLGLKGTVAGRFFWQLGTRTVDDLGLASLQNCAACVVDHPITPFLFAFDMLMLGAGVGYNIQRENVYKIPKLSKKKVKIDRVDDNGADFIIPDSRSGWVKFLGKVLKSYFYSGKGFTYSTKAIRGKGTPIKGFGGVASGPEDLVNGITEICKILDSRRGNNVRPIDCLDIMNIIGMIVVSGNVRRSAQIAIGDYDDLQFLNAKKWSLGTIPNWRAMSNNSVVCNDFSKLPNEFWEGYLGNGEPYGLINLKLSQQVGRAGETQYSDPDVVAYNPSLRKGTKVWTSEGIIPIEKLQDKEFTVTNLNGVSAKAKCWLSGKGKQLYKITLVGGAEYFCTPEHKWAIYTKQGYVKAETYELKPGHRFPIVKKTSLEFGNKGTYEDGFAIGWLYGDGWITERKDNGKIQYGWIVSNKDIESGIDLKIQTFLEKVTGKQHEGCTRSHGKEYNSANDSLKIYMDSFGVSHKSKGLPSSIWDIASEEFRKGFIDGIFSSDGCIIKNYKSASINISQSNKLLIDDLSELLGFYGIKHCVSHYHTDSATFPNGKVYDREYDRYTLKIAFQDSIGHFRDLFKLSIDYKQKSLNEIYVSEVQPISSSQYIIKSVELTDIHEDVWDVTVFDDTHCFQLAHVITGNCAEQSLNNMESCCLAELHLQNIDSKEELLKIIKYLYRICKHSLSLKCHLPETEAIVHKNMRMGIGVTGYLMVSEEKKSWLKDAYTELREFDKEYSAKHGFNESIKLTTTKPSGTLSLLSGATSGAHPAYAKYFLRRVRMASNAPLVDVCRQNGYPIEYVQNFDGTNDMNTVVISFPCSVPDEAVLAKDCSAIDQLEVVKRLQSEWSDNAVSVTIYYKKEELDGIKDWLSKNYNNSLKTVSFLLHNDHGFKQAPLEEITKEQYDELSSKVIPITGVNIDESSISSDQIGCEMGVCPIK